jgi:hypothetical protein
MKRFDLSMSWFQTAKRFLIIFGFFWLLFLARLSSRIADPTTFYVLSAGFALMILLGTYYRYAWYFKDSYLALDDAQINWYRNHEDHLFQIADIMAVRLPNRIAQYYGLSYLQIKFRTGPNLNLDPIVPNYDEIIDELIIRMKKHAHLNEITAAIEASNGV